MVLRMIVATTNNNIIGIDGKMPWHCSGDLKHFRRSTLNSTIIYGRKTFESLGSRPLPGRHNIILTRSRLAISAPNAETSNNLASAIQQAKTEDVWIAGGANVYSQALPLCSELWISLIDPQCYDFKFTSNQEVTMFPSEYTNYFNLDSYELHDKFVLKKYIKL